MSYKCKFHKVFVLKTFSNRSGKKLFFSKRTLISIERKLFVQIEILLLKKFVYLRLELFRIVLILFAADDPLSSRYLHLDSD